MKIDMWRVSIEKRGLGIGGWGLGLVGVLMNWPERLPVVPRSADSRRVAGGAPAEGPQPQFEFVA